MALRHNIIDINLDDASRADMEKLFYVMTQPQGAWLMLNNGMVETAQCGPSRISHYTGRYTKSHGAFFHGQSDIASLLSGSPGWWDNITANRQNAIAYRLRKAGYWTCHIGKDLNHYPWVKGHQYIPEGWSDFHGVINDSPQTGSDHNAATFTTSGGANVEGWHQIHYQNYSLLRRGMLVPNIMRYDYGAYSGSPTAPRVAGATTDTWGASQMGTGANSTTDNVLNRRWNTAPATSYITDVMNMITQEAIEKLPQPFYIHIGHRAPHGQIFVAGRHASASVGTPSQPTSFMNGRSVTDGVTNTGSTNITSATAAFASDDVGKPISGTNIPSGATIASVQSATQATMSASATGSGSGLTLRVSMEPDWGEETGGGTFTSQQSHQLSVWRANQPVDESIRDIIYALQNRPGGSILANTIIVIRCDNGTLYGEHGHSNKWRPWEECVNIPIYIRWDGMAAALKNTTDSTSLAQQVDMMPTFAEIAGAELPVSPDGQSLLPYLQGSIPFSQFRQNAFLEFVDAPAGVSDDSGRTSVPGWRAVRTNDAGDGKKWKYITKVTDGNGNAITPVEHLYCLTDDPKELTNQASNTAYTSIKAELSRRLSGLYSG